MSEDMIQQASCLPMKDEIYAKGYKDGYTKAYSELSKYLEKAYIDKPIVFEAIQKEIKECDL